MLTVTNVTLFSQSDRIQLYKILIVRIFKESIFELLIQVPISKMIYVSVWYLNSQNWKQILAIFIIVRLTRQYLSTAGFLFARFGSKNRLSSRDAVLLYSFLKSRLTFADVRHSILWFSHVAGRVVHNIKRVGMCVCVSLKHRTCSTPRRRLMHFYGGVKIIYKL